ncbi:MAG: DUF3536 domain-containing protein [Chloroflexi bacterium]|nr:DUF3536 domain-containing protein [Chloroflexota bacterium]
MSKKPKSISQAMYTSCASFRDNLSRIEPRNAIGCAAGAIELVGGADGAALESRFLQGLARAVSKESGESGVAIYAAWLKRSGGLATDGARSLGGL